MASIASGSSGNCTYIGTDNTHILIDAGVSMKRINEGLKELGLSPDDIDAVFVTHEHSDHIAGLPLMEKNFGLPIYATAGTSEGIKKADTGGRIDVGLFNFVRADEKISFKELEITPVAISHDAAEPVAFRVQSRDKSVAVATDMGIWDERIKTALTGLNAFLIEANHDVRMLQAGPYPYSLKRRILGDTGHLSNDACGALVNELLHDDLSCILLGHLSDKNNLPELAYETIRVEIELNDTPYRGDDFRIEVAPRHGLSRIIEV